MKTLRTKCTVYCAVCSSEHTIHCPVALRVCKKTSNQPKRDDDCTTPWKDPQPLVYDPTKQLTGEADAAGPVLPNQSVSDVQASPTAGQIRRASQKVRRPRKFAIVRTTFPSSPHRDLEFVAHTDHSSKDWDGTGRTQGGCIISAADLDECWRSGSVEPPGLDVAETEKF